MRRRGGDSALAVPNRTVQFGSTQGLVSEDESYYDDDDAGGELVVDDVRDDEEDEEDDESESSMSATSWREGQPPRPGHTEVYGEARDAVPPIQRFPTGFSASRAQLPWTNKEQLSARRERVLREVQQARFEDEPLLTARSTQAERHAALPWWAKLLHRFGVDCCLEPQITLNDVGLTDEEAEEVKMLALFDEDELRTLCYRFKDLDLREANRLTFHQFMAMPEFRFNPLRDRVQEVLDDGNNSLDFTAFIKKLSVFSDHTSRREKLDFLFRLYDCDGDGLLSRRDLFEVFVRVLPTTFSEEEINQCVDRVFEETDSNHDDHITPAEFRITTRKADVETTIRLHLEA